MGVDLKFTTAGAPDHTYYSLLKFGDNNKLDATLRALSDGQGNDIGIKISNTQVSIDSTLIMGSLTASKLVYLNASKELVTIADGTAGQALVTDGAGGYSFATVAGGGGITINSTAITSGTAGRILFENASNQVSEAAGLTYSSGLFTVLGTTQQAKFAYDASNHLGITIDSSGNATFGLTGTTPKFTFSQGINFGGNLVSSAAQTWGLATAVSALNIQSGLLNIDTTNSRVGVGTAAPSSLFSVGATSQYRVGVSGDLTIAKSGSGSGALIVSAGAGGSSAIKLIDFALTLGTSSAEHDSMHLKTTVTNSGTSGYNCLKINVIETTIGSGVRNLLRVQNNSVDILTLDALGLLKNISTTEQLRLGYNSTNYASFTTASNGDLTIALTGTTPTVKFSTKVQLSDVDLILGTTTGSKIGSTSSQKLAFWGKTPIVQPTTAIARTVHTSVGGTVINDNDTFGGYTLDQAITALINCGILA